MIASPLLAVVLAALPALAQVTPQQIYPAQLNDTSNYGTNGSFYIQVVSSEPAWDGHNVQLRRDPTCDQLIAGIGNTTDPVATFRMKDAELFYTKRTLTNQQYDAGPVGGLVEAGSYNDTRYQSLVFRNATGGEPAEFTASQENWYLTGGLSSYRLFQKEVPTGVTNGFILCSDQKTPGSAGFWELVYAESKQNSTQGDVAAPWCGYVGLQAVLQYSKGEYN